jgi:hypothetical protein
VRDQRCDLVGHAIPGRLAGAGRRAAGVRSGLLEDALAAPASFAGLGERASQTGLIDPVVPV